MNEKDTALLSDDYGRDLASVQALQRKHEGLERDLAALEDKVVYDIHSSFIISSYSSSAAAGVQVNMLKQEAAQMTGAQPAAARVIREKEREALDAWSCLKSRVSLICLHARWVVMSATKISTTE